MAIIITLHPHPHNHTHFPRGRVAIKTTENLRVSKYPNQYPNLSTSSFQTSKPFARCPSLLLPNSTCSSLNPNPRLGTAAPCHRHTHTSIQAHSITHANTLCIRPRSAIHATLAQRMHESLWHTNARTCSLTSSEPLAANAHLLLPQQTCCAKHPDSSMLQHARCSTSHLQHTLCSIPQR